MWRRGKSGDSIKGLPIPIISGGDPAAGGHAAPAFIPEFALYRGDPGEKPADHRGPGREGGGHDAEQPPQPPLFRAAGVFARQRGKLTFSSL